MRSSVSGPPCTLLEQTVFDVQGHFVGRVAAVGTRHGELHRIGIESPGPQPASLRFVARERFTFDGDRVVLTL